MMKSVFYLTIKLVKRQCWNKASDNIKGKPERSIYGSKTILGTPA
jgi:hypothetical protein